MLIPSFFSNFKLFSVAILLFNFCLFVILLLFCMWILLFWKFKTFVILLIFVIFSFRLKKLISLFFCKFKIWWWLSAPNLECNFRLPYLWWKRFIFIVFCFLIAIFLCFRIVLRFRFKLLRFKGRFKLFWMYLNIIDLNEIESGLFLHDRLVKYLFLPWYVIFYIFHFSIYFWTIFFFNNLLINL